MSDKHVRVILSAKDNNFTRALDNVNKQLSGLTSGAKKSEKNTNSLFSSIVKGGLVTAAAAKGFQILSASIGDAVSRYDILNRFPKQMKGLGFATDEVESSTQKLSKGIEGLPTRLDEVVSTASKFALMNKDLSYSTDLTLALNNAFLASGAGADEAQRGLVQFTQMMSKGKVDMQSWFTLTDTMGIGLNQLAESFGFAGESAQSDLYDALKSGEITFKQFSDKIIEMDKQVGGFADQAKTASEGIATSAKNIGTSVVNGLAKVITALDNLSKAFTGNSIAKNMDILKGIITAGFDIIVKSILMVEPIARGLGNVFKFLANDSVILGPALMGVAAAFVALKVVQQINKFLSENNINDYRIDNIGAREKMINNLLLLIQIFAYGFMIVMTLIALTNVFNAISSNVYSRQTEFASLISLGMSSKQMNLMSFYESLILGIKALFWGILIGLLANYLIYIGMKSSIEAMTYQIPWIALLVSILTTFIIIFLIMKYSVGKIKSQNIIATIRNENI